MGIIVMVNTLLYLIIPIHLTLLRIPTVVSSNGTNLTVITTLCIIQTLSFYRVINIIYLIESNFIPFFIMFTASVLTIRVLLMSRRRVEAIDSREMKRRRAKDVKFAINSIVLDIIFVLFQTPVCLGYFLEIHDLNTYFLYAGVFYLLNYSIPIFTYLLTNSIFRREILILIGFKRFLRHSATQTRFDTKA